MEAVCVGAVGEDARYYCMSWGCRQQWIAARLRGSHITCWKGMDGKSSTLSVLVDPSGPVEGWGERGGGVDDLFVRGKCHGSVGGTS